MQRYITANFEGEPREVCGLIRKAHIIYFRKSKFEKICSCVYEGAWQSVDWVFETEARRLSRKYAEEWKKKVK